MQNRNIYLLSGYIVGEHVLYKQCVKPTVLKPPNEEQTVCACICFVVNVVLLDSYLLLSLFYDDGNADDTEHIPIIPV